MLVSLGILVNEVGTGILGEKRASKDGGKADEEYPEWESKFGEEVSGFAVKMGKDVDNRHVG